MLNVDLSKVVPRSAFVYLFAFVPGLFFEISVMLGNPDLVTRVLCQPRRAFHLRHYEELAIGAFAAFVIGSAFMFVVCPLIQIAVGYGYRVWGFLREKIYRLILLRLLIWLLSMPSWRRQWVVNIHRYVAFKAFPSLDELNRAYNCWLKLARKLLETRYGIKLDEIDREWTWLFWTLGSPTGEEVRGYPFAIAIHATGWLGLAASQIAPPLRNAYYIAFCALMIVVGLQHDFCVVRGYLDPVRVASTRIRASMREYDKSAAEPNKAVKLTISPDDLAP